MVSVGCFGQVLPTDTIDLYPLGFPPMVSVTACALVLYLRRGWYLRAIFTYGYQRVWYMDRWYLMTETRLFFFTSRAHPESFAYVILWVSGAPFVFRIFGVSPRVRINSSCSSRVFGGWFLRATPPLFGFHLERRPRNNRNNDDIHPLSTRVLLFSPRG